MKYIRKIFESTNTKLDLSDEFQSITDICDNNSNNFKIIIDKKEVTIAYKFDNISKTDDQIVEYSKYLKNLSNLIDEFLLICDRLKYEKYKFSIYRDTDTLRFIIVEKTSTIDFITAEDGEFIIDKLKLDIYLNLNFNVQLDNINITKHVLHKGEYIFTAHIKISEINDDIFHDIEKIFTSFDHDNENYIYIHSVYLHGEEIEIEFVDNIWVSLDIL